MTPERWRQIEAVFENALEVSSGERLAFVEQTCADDAELRLEVESLLDAHGKVGDLFDHKSLFVPDEQPNEETVTLSAGQLIGHYTIISLIGRGGMGEIYRARDPKLGRDVALKVLPATFSSDAQRLRRFVQEAKAASALNHPNILTIHEIDQSTSSHFMVMEFVEGQTLTDKIHRDKIDLRKLLEYLAQVTDGLAKAHAAGIVHRDLKPDNIMVTHDGYAKVLDFGGTRLADAGVDVVKIKELMGHASIVTTMRYIHATDQGKRGAITCLVGVSQAASPKRWSQVGHKRKAAGPMIHWNLPQSH